MGQLDLRVLLVPVAQYHLFHPLFLMVQEDLEVQLDLEILLHLWHLEGQEILTGQMSLLVHSVQMDQ